MRVFKLGGREVCNGICRVDDEGMSRTHYIYLEVPDVLRGKVESDRCFLHAA